MNNNLWFGVIFGAVFLAIIYFVAIVLIAVLRRALWWFSGLFFFLDEVMWFLYNPLRPLMKNREHKANRLFFFLFTMVLLKPVWQLVVWILTTPLRLITALYFDVLVYLFVSLSDGIDELFHPKLGAMRFKTGFQYGWRWVVFFPKRLVWLLVKNALAVIDSVMMFTLSLIWPTFTMYHGTSKANVVNISREGHWLVGPGNFAGSGIYFGRSPRVAISYSRGSRHGEEGRVIIARVTLTMLRNCATLLESKRSLVAKSGDGGSQLAKAIHFPFYATEFWRTDHKWWEYCLVQGGRDGQHVKSWRIRPIGYVHIKGDNALGGSLERLWGGKAHYCLNASNVAITVSSAGFMWWLLSSVI
tara:strand:+ start:8532 stop:9605 length:1074 start_codon:yes stop_codon:yes gene_type:complete